MSIKIDSPQIKALITEIENITGNISGHDKFVKIANLIESKSKEHISITTLERIWGYSTRNASNVSERTLDILASVVGAKSWNDFCTQQSSNKESELFENNDTINCDNIEKGTLIRLGWQPDRICIVEYLGNYRFVAVESENATIKPGDTFRCLKIQKGKEFHMDNFTRCNEPTTSNAQYVVGRTNGLSIVEIISKEQM